MRKISAGLPVRVLVGSGIVACLALSGAAPAALANATTAKTVTAVRPAGAAALPGYTSAPGWLMSVSAVSANNAWAVGLSAVKGGLIFHWNGKRWSYVNLAGYFNGVAARSATDVWAVGATSQFSDSQPLAVHWNGRSWTRVPTPTLKIGGYFNAVADSSASSVWAVGLAGPGRGGITTAVQLIERWNGKHWTVQHFPSLPGGGQFSGVAALSAGNAWAVGSTGSQTLAEHWNGAKWSRWASPSPLPGVGASALRAVTMIAANNAWAVGYVNLPDGSSRTLTAFWNGHRWRLVASGSRGDNAALFGVTASWTNNIWAVGTAYGVPGCLGESCGPFLTLIMHWNGTRWKVVPSPNPQETISIALNGVTAVTRDNIWAVGNANSSSTLIVHWNGKAWS